MSGDDQGAGRSIFLRYATRRRDFMIASLVVGFAVGLEVHGIEPLT